MITTYINKPDILKWYIYKNLLTMRLTTVILMVSMLQVRASTVTEMFTHTNYNNLCKDSKLDVTASINPNFRISTIHNVDMSFANHNLPSTKNERIIKRVQRSFRKQMVGFIKFIDVRGKVVGENDQPLVGVTVKVKGDVNSTPSNSNGEFFLKDVDQNAVLVFSFVGYAIKEVKARNNVGVVKLFLSNDRLEETVIIGYGQTTRRLNTGSVSTITSKDIAGQPVSNPLAAMAGRIPGVQISQDTGVPGGTFTVKIRGQNTLRYEANYPLYIIDGVPFTSTSISSSHISNNITGDNSSPLNNISPSDIERIDVLKDGDATSIYGSRGANGVVLITTKHGQPGKVKFDVSTYLGFGQIENRLDLLNTQQYLEVRREAFENDGTTPGITDYDVNGTWDQNAYTDWQKVLIGGTASISNLQANVSGGNGQTTFMFGVTDNKEGTVFPGNNNSKRSSAKLAITQNDLNNNFKVSTNFNYSSSINSLFNYSLAAFIFNPPNTPPIFTSSGGLNWESGFNNPFAQLEKKYTTETKIFQGSAALQYNIPFGLEFKSTIGYSTMQMDEIQTNPMASFNPAYNPTAENRRSHFNDAKFSTWVIEPQIDYKTKIFAGSFSMLIGATFQKDKKRNHNLTANGFASDFLLENIGSAASIVVSDSKLSIYKYNALFGRINYQLSNKYIFNITARRDGSSRFGPGKQFGNFFSGGLAWIFSEEQFLKKFAPFISFGKLKTSYGTTGSDAIGNYQFLETWSSTTYSYAGDNGVAPSRLLNANFAWEENRKFDASLELLFLKNKLQFSINYYNNQSSNQLVGYALAPSVGFSSVQSNLNALIRNTGTELVVGFTSGNSKSLVWSSSINLTIPKNKLVKFPGFIGSSYANTYELGKSLNVIKAYKYLGIDPGSGVYNFEDQNKDGTLSFESDLVADRIIGETYYGGFQNSIAYRKWNFDVFFQFVRQTDRDFLFNAPGMMANFPNRLLSRWNMENEHYRVQKYTASLGSSAGIAYFNYRNSTGNIVDASFLRLKNVSISYNLQTNFTKRLKIQSSKIFIQGQNLLTLTRYEGLDPETTSILPPLRVLTAGFSLTF